MGFQEHLHELYINATIPGTPSRRAPNKAHFFSNKKTNITVFLISPQNLCSAFSLEMP